MITNIVINIQIQAAKTIPATTTYTRTKAGLYTRISVKKKEINKNKCVSKTDTNPPFAFEIAFPRAQISQGFYREGQKVETYNRKFQFESNLESNRRIVVYSFSVKFFSIAI